MTLTSLLGITLPILQAPMAGSQGSALALAVSGAGGLGALPCAMLGADALRNEISTLAASGRPYNVNFFAHTPPPPDAAAEAAWRALLAPYYEELGVPLGAASTAPSRKPFDAATAELLAAFRPPVVSFHFGLPDETLLTGLRGWGAKILASATTVEEARWLEQRGVDVIIAQGLEAGGHRGMFLTEDLTTQTGTLALVPQVVQAVRVPVVAAGGIADARGVAAVMRLGAAGAQIGTAYLLCPEAAPTALHRAALQSPDASHTALTNLYSGRPARGIVNRLMRELGPLNDKAPRFPLASAALAPLRAKAEALGSSDFSPLWAGQNTSCCRAIPAAELTRALAATAIAESIQ